MRFWRLLIARYRGALAGAVVTNGDIQLIHQVDTVT
jgi:hypothetical protein